MEFCGIIVAGGSGLRAGPGGAKQWRMLAGKPVARWSLEALIRAGARGVVVVIPDGDQAIAAQAFAGLEGWSLAIGGTTRDLSTRAGLAALAALSPEAVLIHDAARPFLDLNLISSLLTALETAPGAIPALPAVDTLKRRDLATGVITTADRTGLYRAQTPQAFHFSAIMRAFEAWPADETPTDDAQILERAGGAVAIVEGDPLLMKLTYPEDFLMAERLARAERVMRIGQGFDAHRFGAGDAVWLCGVRIPHDQALIGHSDADAGLHALTDALLGAIGDGDIGDHFPPGDPRWRGAPSSVFLTHAADLIAARGGRILNVDLTLICERPKIKPHRAAMRAEVARLLGLELDQVSVKATTTEAMGFTGREEGLAASAVAAIDLPAV